jgi:homoserine O-acetyltransferase
MLQVSEGWWRPIVGTGKVINTETYSILAFNIPGNGQDKNLSSLIDNYRGLYSRGYSSSFHISLKILKDNKAFCLLLVAQLEGE